MPAKILQFPALQPDAEAPRTAEGIPLVGLDEIDLKDAQVAPLIVALADIIESACVRPAAVPVTHAQAA